MFSADLGVWRNSFRFRPRLSLLRRPLDRGRTVPRLGPTQSSRLHLVLLQSVLLPPYRSRRPAFNLLLLLHVLLRDRFPRDTVLVDLGIPLVLVAFTERIVASGRSTGDGNLNNEQYLYIRF